MENFIPHDSWSQQQDVMTVLLICWIVLTLVTAVWFVALAVRTIRGGR